MYMLGIFLKYLVLVGGLKKKRVKKFLSKNSIMYKHVGK